MEAEDKVYKVGAGRLSQWEYQTLYRQSIEDSDGFWRAEGMQRIDWIRPFTQVSDVSYTLPDVHVKWYYDGTLNACYNCVDRHVQRGLGDRVAIIWEGNDSQYNSKITYRQLLAHVCRLANGLKSLGVKRGDRVTIYMPMVPEIVYAMLACARLGAIHSVVFGGYSPDSIAGRIDDCASEWIITAEESCRAQKSTPLKSQIDEALQKCKQKVQKVVVLKAHRPDHIHNWVTDRDLDYATLVENQSEECPFEEMGAEDPLFILYTSGSTGKPKGVLHTTGGYCVYASYSQERVFDYHQGEIFWCTADCGWITGHTYTVYGSLLNGATTLVFEGIPNYPTFSRCWEIVDKYGVNIFYTAPTLIRSLMAKGDEPVKSSSRKTLRLLGSVGEPINPEAWRWYFNVVGEGRCPIVDTWWQTETGGILISALPGTTLLKPGSATFPQLGVLPVIVDNEGRELQGACEGNLCLARSWPGQMRTVYGNHKRFIETYFSSFPGKYFSGDGCRRDQDGYIWITGRVDDIIIVSGHNLSTAEIESSLVAHSDVAEAAAVGYPHDIKGYGLYVFVTLKSGVEGTEALKKQLVLQVRKIIGPFAAPDFVQFAPALPKTRSGKIMRRILRKIVENDFAHLGDTSTLADPGVVEELKKHVLTKIIH